MTIFLIVLWFVILGVGIYLYFHKKEYKRVKHIHDTLWNLINNPPERIVKAMEIRTRAFFANWIKEHTQEIALQKKLINNEEVYKYFDDVVYNELASENWETDDIKEWNIILNKYGK